MNGVLELNGGNLILIPAQLPSSLDGTGQVSEYFQMMTKRTGLIYYY